MQQHIKEQLQTAAMSVGDLPVAIEFAAKEGWNPGLNDHSTFWEADPNGFFKGTIDNEIVSTISGVTYGHEFSFIGLYITKPAHRGKGYGTQLMRKCLEYIGDRNCGLDGVVAMVHKYEEFGFKSVCRNTRFVGLAGARSIPKEVSDRIVDLKDYDTQALLEFDRKIFSVDRSTFLRAWIAQVGCYARAIKNNGTLAGYYVARPCLEGFKIGPLFAENAELASYLLDDACNHIPGSKITLDILGSNKSAHKLARDRGMSPSFETERMYTKSDPLTLPDCVYGITSFELG